MSQDRQVPAVGARTVQEDIRLVSHQPGLGVAVHVGVLNAGMQPGDDATWDPGFPTETFWIGDDPAAKEGPIMDYAELMSANPAWAPEKPGGTFRQQDLWHFVTEIRARRAAKE